MSSGNTDELQALVSEAVIYAYPLYEMCRMRAATSPRLCDAGPADAQPSGPLRWCNVFIHARKLLGPGKSRVVTPNNDTLYTNAWLDLDAEPLVIDVPDTAGRYYVLGLLDFYTNPFASLGSRTTGTGARSFLVTGPNWRGEIPEALRAPGAHVPSATRWVWIIGRILVDGPADEPAVHALQDDFLLRPLGAWNARKSGSAPLRFDPACDPKAPLEARHFARLVNRALRENPPPAGEREHVARFAAVGIAAGDGEIDDAAAALLQQALDTVATQLKDEGMGSGSAGWQTMPLLGASFGTQYRRRAAIALKYIGALESREASYPMATHDAEGLPLSGRHRYRLHFAPGALPPVKAFWSLTMYGSDDYMLAANPIDRYAIGDRTPGLCADADGGLTIHIQHAAPATPEALANWLPAPVGDFYLCLRAYVPEESLIDGRYRLPPLERADSGDGP
jgi:hypothetical protein